MSVSDTDLQTPRSTRPRISATSTVNKAKPTQLETPLVDPHLETSLSVLSLNSIDLSNIVDVPPVRSSIDLVLSQQRQLANSTLQRASKVGAIPSKLLQPDLFQTKTDTLFNFQSESTVNDSDLLLKNTSTPRNSSHDVGLIHTVPSTTRDSIFAVFKDMLDNNVSTHDAIGEFKQISQAHRRESSHLLDSNLFLPAEDAAQQMLTDELSWKKKNEIPVTQDLNSFQDTRDLPSRSIGEFFQKRSDNISELRATSPRKLEPFALIDSTDVLNQTSDSTDESPFTKSLSASAIQQLLLETDDTPRKVMDYLFNQKRKTSPKRSENPRRNSSGDTFSLPVSRDTSYTSSFSDNEAVRAVVNEDKENIQPVKKKVEKLETNPQLSHNVLSPSEPRLLSPSRSSSSLTSLPNGKLPIESTVSELVWGCVKVDRCVTKEFMLRNKTPKTLRLQCSLSTYEFKIRKDNRSDSDPLSACKFVLHGHESRPLIISYIPTKVGAAVDELVFTPLDTNLTQTKKQCVRLWGYGGYTNIEYHNAIRDNTGKYWLSLGRMDNRVIMEQSLTLKNTGNLPSFAHIKVVSKHVTFSNLKVEPILFVLLPNEEKHIKMTYIPNAKDCKILKQNLNVLSVTDIAKLEISSGPEISRARLRRLYRKCIEKGLTVDPRLKVLKEKIIGEIFPSDIIKFKESPNALLEILETLNNDEIVVTIEQDPNQTLVAEFTEDSVMYQSLSQETIVALDDSSISHTSCRLEPPCLVLLPPSKTEDSLFLISEATKTLHYEVRATPSGLSISPTVGALSPGETSEFKVKLLRNNLDTRFKVLVYVDNAVFEAEVKVLPVRPTRKNFLE